MELPVPVEWKRIMKSEGEIVLTLSIRRPSFPDSGKSRRAERYFAQMAEQWKLRWETTLFPRACQALAGARENSRPFTPWQASLDHEVTLQQPDLLSLRLDAVEATDSPKPLRICMGEVWDCTSGYPRPLRSFFPAKNHHWRRELIDRLRTQVNEQIASGESLLDPDCAQVMAQTFDPDRFYLTEQGLVIFYPLYILGPYAEGIPTFTVPLPT